MQMAYKLPMHVPLGGHVDKCVPVAMSHIYYHTFPVCGKDSFTLMAPCVWQGFHQLLLFVLCTEAKK